MNFSQLTSEAVSSPVLFDVNSCLVYLIRLIAVPLTVLVLFTRVRIIAGFTQFLLELFCMRLSHMSHMTSVSCLMSQVVLLQTAHSWANAGVGFAAHIPRVLILRGLLEHFHCQVHPYLFLYVNLQTMSF